MDNDLLAVLTETSRVGPILTFTNVKLFYYVLGNTIKSFDYSVGISAVIYEGMSDITCIEKFDNGENTSKIFQNKPKYSYHCWSKRWHN